MRFYVLLPLFVILVAVSSTVNALTSFPWKGQHQFVTSSNTSLILSSTTNFEGDFSVEVQNSSLRAKVTLNAQGAIVQTGGIYDGFASLAPSTQILWVPLQFSGNSVSGTFKKAAAELTGGVWGGYYEYSIQGRVTLVDGSYVLSGTFSEDYSHLVYLLAGVVNTTASGVISGAFVIPVDLPRSYPVPLLASASFKEPNNTPAQALPLLVNDTPALQLLSNVDSQDWFEFFVKTGRRYTIEIPGNSIGKSINPAVQVFDSAGNALTGLVERNADGQSITVQVTAASSGLYRIRVSNQAPYAKNSGLDNQYQLRVFLTDQPQQGIIKGFVLNDCSLRGINEAEVSSLLGGVVNNSTLTFSTGEFSLPLNPDTYQVKSLANTFKEKIAGPVSVSLDDIAQIRLDQSPNNGCTAEMLKPLDPILQEQQAVAIYNEATGLLVIRDVIFNNAVFFVEMQNIGNNRFKISRFMQIPGTIHAFPADYEAGKGLVNLPQIFAFGRTWNVQLKNDEQFVFDIIKFEAAD